MKRLFDIEGTGTGFDDLRRRLAGQSGRRLWRSLDELAGDDDFVDMLRREFPDNASELTDPVSRRRFLQLMGASLALGGATACVRQSPERILPYVRQPEELIPGRPLYYASASPRFGYGHGILVESHMGRPTKIEGNPDHPASLGGTDATIQAEILQLYDPDRSQVVRRRGRISTWESFLGSFTSLLAEQEGGGGAGMRLLLPTLASPTLAAQLRRLAERFPQARLHRFDTAGRDEVRRGAELAFGTPADTRYHLDRAEVVVALDADFLNAMPGSVRYAREFADGRRVRADRRAMSRLYAVECTPSSSGAVADHRWPVRPSEIEPLAAEIAARLGIDGASERRRGIPASIETAWLDALVDDLLAHAGSSVVIAGDHQDAIVHALAHAINDRLGNVGSTVAYTDPVDPLAAMSPGTLSELVAAMNAGAVSVLAILGGNPVFDAPADLDFAAALDQVETRLHVGLHENETSALCHWHVPEAHFLEAWGDLRAFDGTAAIVQPLIEPLYDGHSLIEVLAVMLGEPGREGYEIVRAHWQTAWEAGEVGEAEAETGAAATTTAQPGSPREAGAARTGEAGSPPEAAAATIGFERFWRRAIHDGVIAGSAATPVDVAARPLSSLPPYEVPAAAEGSLEIVFRPDPTIHDGRYANNGWLQELPKPLTLLTWDNAALLGPRTAERLGLANGQQVRIERDGRSIEAPVWVLPGQPDDVVTVHFGYGRGRTGRVGTGTGFDAYPLRTSDALWRGTGVTLEPTGARVPLATTQHHHSMEGRDLVRVGTLAEFQETGTIGHDEHHEPGPEESLYPPWQYDGYSWGMTIDLNVCTGCNGCMTACQAENNVPVVGKQQVLQSRDMHWLRIDRYFAADLDNPEVYFQPVTCMHCENAPCEVVCPVAATVHGNEGLNEMVYNRCVGTRYCANNCPYKVRRFNFLDYRQRDTPISKLLYNPDVTVRSRGVMEKCTYCVQRINHARIEAKNEGRSIRDGEVTPACAQACPSQAITFGDINDPTSRVSRQRREPLHYGLLAELGTRPRTNYLAKLRNPNPAIEAAGGAEPSVAAGAGNGRPQPAGPGVAAGIGNGRPRPAESD